MKNLGFGMMRLPVLSGATDFDYEQLNNMVDEFLAQGSPISIQVLYITKERARKPYVNHWWSAIRAAHIQ